MKISFLVFLVSAIMLALFAPTGEAKGRVPPIRRTNFGSMANGIRKNLGKRAVNPTRPGLM